MDEDAENELDESLETGSKYKLDPSRDNESMFKRVVSKTLLALNAEKGEKEVTREVSLLRSTSMLFSVPDMGEFKKSCKVDIEETPVRNRRISRNESILTTNVSPNKSMSRVGSASQNSQLRLKLPKPILRRANNSNLSYMTEKGRESSNSITQSELAIEEEDEYALQKIDETDSLHDNKGDKTPIISDAPVQPSRPGFRSKVAKVLKAMTSCFDPEVLKTRKMLVASVAIGLMTMGSPHALFYLHAYAESIDMDLSHVTNLLSISSLVDLIFRLSVGALADLNIIPVPYIFAFG